MYLVTAFYAEVMEVVLQNATAPNSFLPTMVLPDAI